MGLLVTEYNGYRAAHRHDLIENNVFAASGSRAATTPLAFNQQGRLVRRSRSCRHNSFLQATMWPDPQPGPRGSARFRVSGENAAVAGPTNCDRHIELLPQRLGERAPLRPGRPHRADGFRDPASADVRLRPGAAAIDHGDPKSFPATDVDGHRRPRGRAPDAGAVKSG